MNIEIKIVNKIIILVDGERVVLIGGYSVDSEINIVTFYDTWGYFKIKVHFIYPTPCGLSSNNIYK